MTRELLSEVLGGDVINVESGEHFVFYFDTLLEKRQGINIYELAHTCKEWALTEHYYLYTWQREKSATCSLKRIINTPPYVEEVGLYNMDTEPEAIFKACEWILEREEDA